MPTQMIDEGWLEQLRLDGSEGMKIGGFIGQGAENVQVKATQRDGKSLAIRIAKPNVGLYIREFPPPFLTVVNFILFSALTKSLPHW